MAKVVILCVALWWLMGGALPGVARKGRWGRLTGRSLAGWRLLLYRLFLAAVFLTLAVRLMSILWQSGGRPRWWPVP